ncbi:lytic transglycosylase domain-containing protein [Methylibium petroleiphilum]|uniref:Invasion protein n=1 Tax=Methylibium petroleiphilum (strain ATCC BAA-1232 / LMG 22953 / PM1) TaxID=420662 RepID=A2SNL5_METPP|nr:lytic transglycosylase domain-containing protein [Methylibium petroleiphilum]ABM97154.1 Invasion protein [Methylibium petroleiphilum PM1]
MKRSTKALLAAAALAIAGQAHAMCFKEAAERYKVSEALLRAIAKTESNFNPKALNRNSNGTEDIGVMQINSSWLPTLAQFGIGREQLKDPCTNVNIGAWVLANNIARHGETWRAVGAYNAATPSKQVVYVEKVWLNSIKLKKNGTP